MLHTLVIKCIACCGGNFYVQNRSLIVIIIIKFKSTNNVRVNYKGAGQFFMTELNIEILYHIL